ncbi:MAG TPA: hypothetical protein VGT61_13640 [Thermomicrobiales bacterium]|nr:hypothetical protein [Thermomicrobiales bacterium]
MRRAMDSETRLPAIRRGIGVVALLLLVLPVLAPGAVAAHARWFTPYGPYWSPEWSRLWSWPVLIAIVAAAGAVVTLAIGQRIVKDPLWPRPPVFQRLEPSAPAILGVQAAITLIYAASQMTLFVPNITLPHDIVGYAIAAVAVVAGFSFITGVLARVGALIVLGLFGLAFAYGSWYEALEQVLFVGIALYLLAVGRGVVRYSDGWEEDRTALSDRLRPHALTILRVGVGASIVILGFTEKLIAPDLSVAFLGEYPEFNVLRSIGLDWFTDERFVYAAGIVEITAGAALISGKLVRVVIVGLWIPFNLGIAFLPPQELIGHLPILSAIYVLLVRGTEGIPPRQAPAEAAPTDPTPTQRPVVPATTATTAVPRSALFTSQPTIAHPTVSARANRLPLSPTGTAPMAPRTRPDGRRAT